MNKEASVNRAESATLRGHAPARRAAGRRPFPVATIAGMAAIVLLFAWVGLGSLFTPTNQHGATNTGATTHTISAVNPLLIIRPRTVTRQAHDGGLGLTLSASPLIPGPNRLVVALTNVTQQVSGAHLNLTATMIGMAMRPLHLPLRELGHGRYAVVAPLSMFGQWRLSLTVAPHHAAPITHIFMLSLDLPRGLYKALSQHTDAR